LLENRSLHLHPALLGAARLFEAAPKAHRLMFSDWGALLRHERCYSLSEHPFGLKIPRDPERGDRYIELTGDPGVPFDEVLKARIAYELSHIYPGCFESWYLRVILAESQKGDPSRHLIFYEVGIGHHVYISGGSTDDSGAGKGSKKQMDEVVAFLHEFYRIPVETVTIPYVRAHDIRDRLWDIIRAEE
jgi:hypothetical protein